MVHTYGAQWLDFWIQHFGNGKFYEAPVHLEEQRYYHSCWGLDDGVLLLGGAKFPESKFSTELVQLDGYSSSPGFPLNVEGYPAGLE